ncbi:hypothetical protein O6H91_21G031900 [Diphasiastrum complanatum]|uniref:Uncharacterized protein n=1 Tax=Diphasiastrum complanatum TaxID=34168 RepID=A0ACC2AJ79_DIPCM|nr:hypothetical protein O6H91_21G031900 [Diphasiastrum complanatum]
MNANQALEWRLLSQCSLHHVGIKRDVLLLLLLVAAELGRTLATGVDGWAKGEMDQSATTRERCGRVLIDYCCIYLTKLCFQ